MSNFLDDLKKAVEVGELNSEAAKKINEINELTTKKFGNSLNEVDLNKLNEKIEDLAKSGGVRTFTEEEAAIINSNNLIEIEKTKSQDKANKLYANLVDIVDMVDESVLEMFSHIIELEDSLKIEFEEENSIYGDLYLKIEEIKNRYISTIK